MYAIDKEHTRIDRPLLGDLRIADSVSFNADINCCIAFPDFIEGDNLPDKPSQAVVRSATN